MTEKPLTQAQKEKAGLQPAVPRITQTVWPKESPSGAYYVQEGEKYTLVNPPPYQPAVYGDKPWAPGDLTQMPNYEKTSGGERWLLRALPGFAQSDVGQALAAFGNTWAGKALGFFDVLAEGLERGIGVGVQATLNLGVPGANKQLLEDQLKSAWYAGSLAADYANTTSEFGIEDGKPYWRVPQDLPGAAGLVEARQSIYRLVQQGMSYSDALEKVRADSYTKAGALAIRMQANDLVFHIFGDPLNIVAGWIKPVERISAAKILTQGKALPADVKAITEAADAARLALKEAEAAGDTARATELAQSVGLMEEGLAELGRMKQMSPLEQRFLRLVGGMPGEESWVNKLPQPLRWIGKQLTLTPEARAYEYVDNIQRNVISYVFNQAKDPYEAVRSLQRLASGTLDRQLAHMVVTPQGRAVRGVAEGMASRATQMLGAYDATTFERQLLDLTAVVLQEPSGAIGIMNRLRNGEAKTIAALLSEKIGIAADGPQTLERLLGSFQHTADELPAIFGRMPVLFDPRKGLEIYTPDLFFHHMTNMVADVASEVGVKMFGVKSRGTLLAASEALKSAETLAFLRVNPAYPVMNFVNNEMTMLARGAYGTFTMQFAEDLWTRLGFIPPRLRAGVGMSGMAENLVQDAIGKMSRTAEKGSVAAGLTNFADWMKGRNLGGFDMGQWAQAVERNASLRAYTTGYLRGNRMFSKAFTRLVADFDPALAKSLGDDLTKVIEDAVRGSMTQKELDAALLGDNLRVNMSSIMDGASQRLGYDIDRVLSTEFTASIERELIDASRRGPAAVRDAIAGISGRVQQHIDTLVEEGIKNLVAETAAKVELEGPGAFAGLWGNITDEFYFAHPKHADNVRRIAEAVEAGADPKAIDLLWRKGLEAEDRYMGRMWNRLEAYVEGMRKGWPKKAPTGPINEVASNFRKWRTGWQNFFKWRNEEYAKFFGARLRGEEYGRAWESISSEAEARYLKLIGQEDQYITRVDDLSAGLLPPEEQALYKSYRDAVAAWRESDRLMVAEYTARIRNLPREARSALWDELWDKRRANWAAIRNTEVAGKRALAGDPEAAALFGKEGQLPLPEAPEAAAAQPAWQQAAMMDLNELVPDQLYMGTGIDQLWFNRGQDALDAIGESAMELGRQKPLKMADLPEGLMSQVRSYIEDAKTGIASRQVASMQMGEFTRDAALLNYNRRYGYNNSLGMLAPYEFWFTQSIGKWALHSLDRPGMLASYLRIKKFLETAYRPEAGLPSRLRGSIRIHLPFLPDWMGKDVFVDPLRMLLPFDRFAYPFEEIMNQQASDAKVTLRKLDELVETGQITREEAEEAKTAQQGSVWDRAMALARQDDAENRKSAFDLMTMFVQPHAPITWAMNAARGKETGAVLPITRTIGGLAGSLGIDPAGPYNPEAAIRKAMGLHPFDEWDDYRVDRELSNMAGDGDISIAEMQLAMAERDKSQDPQVLLAFKEAQKRAYRLWGLGAMGSVLGLPPRFYPSGEEKLRELTSRYQEAWKQYEGGDEKAVTRFLEQYPEYEARLALFKEPAERMRAFMVDQLWDKWNSMPRMWQEEAKEQLGTEFDTLFLSKETRSYEMIPQDTLQMWVSMLGGSVPGKLNGKLSLELAPQDVAWRAQSFYQTRNAFFPNWYDDQEAYYKLEEGSARSAYRADHPLLVQYWDWRREWLKKNPDAAPYMVDDPETLPKYGSEAELEQAQAMQPTLSVEEWQATLGMPLYRLINDSFPIPDAAKEKFETITGQMGFASFEDALNNFAASKRNVLAPR